LRIGSRWRSSLGFAFLVLAFVAFLLYGNVAPAIVLLALGVVFVVSGARPTRGAQAG
jgi:membrane-bound ClpP family serine protease